MPADQSPQDAQGATTIDEDARVVWAYHRLDMTLDQPVDAVFCLCSLDTRVADRAAQLFLDGHGEHLIFSGGSGKLTETCFDKAEAEVFADRARAMGVPPEKILVEPASSNTGENVRFTWQLLQSRRIEIRSFILVQKPYMERRTFATFKKQWPDLKTTITVTSPQIAWEAYPNEENPRELVINIMVGDLVRILEYPNRGFQIPQHIPDDVWKANERLIAAGYTKHLP